MRRMLLVLCGVLGALGSLPAHAQSGVVVNEVMYRPYNQSTYGRYEFIELYNASSTAQDVGGLLLTDSLDWTRICNNLAPADNEGVYRIPGGTVIPARSYLTLWRTPIAGITNQPGNLVYDHFEFGGTLVLNDSGDQVTLLRCQGGPQVIDSLNYATLGLGQTLHNVSLERRSADCPTQDTGTWGASVASAGGLDLNGGYTTGGTPGRANSLTGSCAIQLTTYALSSGYQSQLAAANALYDYASLSAEAYSFPWSASSPPGLQLASNAINGLQDIGYYSWDEYGTATLTQVEAELAPQFGHLLAPLLAELGNGSETVMVAYQRTTYYAAPGASAWRTAYILLFPQSHRIALLQREDVET